MRSQHISTDTAPGRPLWARRNALLTMADVGVASWAGCALILWMVAELNAAGQAASTATRVWAAWVRVFMAVS